MLKLQIQTITFPDSLAVRNGHVMHFGARSCKPKSSVAVSERALAFLIKWHRCNRHNPEPSWLHPDLSADVMLGKTATMWWAWGKGWDSWKFWPWQFLHPSISKFLVMSFLKTSFLQYCKSDFLRMWVRCQPVCYGSSHSLSPQTRASHAAVAQK